jgi:hypothetical protein
MYTATQNTLMTVCECTLDDFHHFILTALVDFIVKVSFGIWFSKFRILI